MPIYEDKEQFYDVVGTVFRQLMADPAASDTLRKTGLVVRLLIQTPDAEFTINTTTAPPSFTLGPDTAPDGKPDGVQADIELRMSADVLHHIWMDDIRLRDAFMQGQVKAEGNLFKALVLGDLFRQAEMTYRQVAKAKGVGGPAGN